MCALACASLLPPFSSCVCCCAQVDVGYNGIGKGAALELIGVLEQKEMVSVGLARCGLGPEEAVAVADYVRDSPSLTSVNLSRNELGPAGVKALVDGGAFTGSLTSVGVALLAPHVAAILPFSYCASCCAGRSQLQQYWQGCCS